LHAELSSTFQNVVYDVTNGFLNVEVVFFFFFQEFDFIVILRVEG